MTGDGKISVLISLPPQGDNHQKSLALLKEAGLRDANLLEALGLVTGRVDRNALARLRKVPGVTVEQDDTVRTQD